MEKYPFLIVHSFRWVLHKFFSFSFSLHLLLFFNLYFLPIFFTEEKEDTHLYLLKNTHRIAVLSFFIVLDCSVVFFLMLIPHVLLEVPAPQVLEKYIDGNVLSLPIEEAGHLSKSYKESVSKYFETSQYDLERDIIPAIEFGLQLFNAENFSGELSPEERKELFSILARFDPTMNLDEKKEETESAQDTTIKRTDPKCAYLQRLLSSDGEMVNPSMRLPGLLLCLVCLVSLRAKDGSPLLPYRCIWRLRVHYRHQLMLTHRAHSVFCEVASCIDAILQAYSDSPKSVPVSELLEVSLAQRYYHRPELAEDTLEKAIKNSGLIVKEECFAGVRTRWQQQAVPQLLLLAESSRLPPMNSKTVEEDQPLTIQGEKDGHDLFDRPRESAQSEAIPCTPLHPEDKAILLMLCDFVKLHDTHHALTTHRMMTYIERLLVDPSPTPFIIRSQILLARSQLEARRNRVQERSFLQMTQLVEQFSSRRNPTLRTLGRTASEFFYTVPYPASWELKVEYANFCFDENLFKTALAMYEETQHWEKIFECCKKLDKRTRAEFLARELIRTDPENPMLWVALGEATRRDEHLWKAWELSSHKMAAPMRSLARLALDRERFDDVIKYFDESVKINPIFGGDWFSLGFACLKARRWERSGEAFTRVCQINPGDAYAWNNLGTILLREDKKRPAFNAISQALKQNRRDWRMWQNYFSIGCELKEVTETANALRVALAIAKSQLQFERVTLELFVDNIISYLKGEIPGTSSDAQEDPKVQDQDHVRYLSMKENENRITEDMIQHIPLETEREDGEVELTELAPLGADFSAVLLNTAGRSHIPENREEKEQRSKIINTRFRHRTRALFLRVLDLFVNDPDIYYCMAKLVAYLDGPLAGYAYKVKELCVSHQKDLWEQDEKLFSRTIEALETTVQLLKCAIKTAFKGYQNPNSAEEFPAPAYIHEKNYIERLEEAAASPTPPVHVDSVPMILSSSSEYHKAVLSALKETQRNITRTFQAAKPHFENSEKLKRLETLSEEVKKQIQNLKYELGIE